MDATGNDQHNAASSAHRLATSPACQRRAHHDTSRIVDIMPSHRRIVCSQADISAITTGEMPMINELLPTLVRPTATKQSCKNVPTAPGAQSSRGV